MSEAPERIDYHPPATFASDLKVLQSMLFADVHGATQQERLESFYVSQADLYDSYRHRMLHGRFPMIQAMPCPKNGVWVDIGGGTGSNLEFFKTSINHWKKIVILDLCSSLIEVAKKRVQQNNWTNVDLIVGDACDFECGGLPAAGSVDVVTFSYAITMIPDWKKAIQNAKRLLKPGGHIAVCDFTVVDSQWYGMGSLWKFIFSQDHVFLNEAHIQELRAEFEEVEYKTGYGQFPYVPLLSCPYYYFIGKKV